MESLSIGILGSTPLALVGRGLSSDWVAIHGTLDVGDRSRIGTGRDVRVDTGITLVVDVEAYAELDAVAECSTGINIVLAALDVLVCEVSNLLGGTLEVGERLDIAAWSSGFLSFLGKDAVSGQIGID